MLKERLHSLYVEQLCERPKPSGRSGTSWDNILSTYRVSFENHLESLDTIESVWLFGEKCLKKDHLREAFREFGFEDVFSSAISQQLQAATVFPVEECERDIAFQDRGARVFNQPLIPGSAVVELDPPTFQCALQSAEKPIDLD